jgi:hypothetical protein
MTLIFAPLHGSRTVGTQDPRAGQCCRRAADCVDMRGGKTFAEVLAAELETGGEVPLSWGRPSDRPMTPPLFVFGTPQFDVRQSPFRPATFHSIGARPAERALPPPTTLTADEQRALGVLNSLGADLTGTPSSSDLRRAYRRLARRYHPDRHPGSSHAEQVRLSRLFAELTDGYRVLAAALDIGATRH